MQPVTVDIVSDVVCPWCVVGYRQLAHAAEQLGVPLAVRWHPFELNPTMADEGEDIAEHLARKYGSTPARSQQARAMLTKLGGEVGFTFDYADDMRIYPTFRAHQLLRWAEEEGLAQGAEGPGAGHRLKQALFAAYFTEGRNINDPDVLVDVAASEGLDADEARAVLADGRYADAVKTAARAWTDRGISGVPAMVFDERHLMVGARGVDGYRALLDHLVAARAAV